MAGSGKQLLFRRRVHEEGARALLPWANFLRVSAGLELRQGLVPIGGDILYGQGYGEHQGWNPDAFQQQGFDILGPDMEQLPAVPFDEALVFDELHLGRRSGMKKLVTVGA